MTDSPKEKRRFIYRTMLKGLRGHCPNCGQAPLFASYLKQVDTCDACGEEWSRVRADDAPAWGTMLIVGHIMAPFFLMIAFNDALPSWAPGLILAAIGAVLCLVILPRVKGAFIGLIWATGAPTS